MGGITSHWRSGQVACQQTSSQVNENSHKVTQQYSSGLHNSSDEDLHVILEQNGLVSAESMESLINSIV